MGCLLLKTSTLQKKMAQKLTEGQKLKIRDMLRQGVESKAIAESLGVTSGQVAAISAHVTMGSYDKGQTKTDFDLAEDEPQSSNILSNFEQIEPQISDKVSSGILLGENIETGDDDYWNPFPESGSTNPHALIVGESGVGKTETIRSIVTELAQKGINSIIFDYGQGFSLDDAPPEFLEYARPIEILASKNGVNINPLQLFPFDINGPLNVAQRVADTFQRVYSQIGVQQHAVLRQAVIELLANSKINAQNEETWKNAPPWFEGLQRQLELLANDTDNPQRRIAANVLSHISTVFVFNTFREGGNKLTWKDMVEADGKVFIIQLKGLENSLERVVTEFLLWNFIGYIESIGPDQLKCFTVLDEAHKLAFDAGSPVEKLLREGRKFGVGLVLASQQPEDFSSVAFSNTATKMIFQVADEDSKISRQISRKLRGGHSFEEIRNTITKLPRGISYVVSENIGYITKIKKICDRGKVWSS